MTRDTYDRLLRAAGGQKGLEEVEEYCGGLERLLRSRGHDARKPHLRAMRNARRLAAALLGVMSECRGSPALPAFPERLVNRPRAAARRLGRPSFSPCKATA